MTENSHGSAKLDFSALEADELKVVEKAAENDAARENIQARLDRVSSRLEAAGRLVFGARDAARELNPPDVHLMTRIASTIGELSVAELECLYLQCMLMNDAATDGGRGS